MSPPFVIPTRNKYWETPHSDDPVDALRTVGWIEREAGRAKALAERLFPDVEFILGTDPPPGQAYDKNSINTRIAELLEAQTGLRLRRSGKNSPGN